jgi:type II secretory pathway component GspD/PulD (secretin)
MYENWKIAQSFLLPWPVVKHQVSNQVTVNNGEFILLGGMMQQSSITHTEGLPKLKTLPFLGWLFGQEKKTSIRL